MPKQYKVSKEIKDEILKKIKEEGKSINELSADYGISAKTIYSWLSKGASKQPSWRDITKLKKENKALLELVGELTVKLS
jgi:transposase-like protein